MRAYVDVVGKKVEKHDEVSLAGNRNVGAGMKLDPLETSDEELVIVLYRGKNFLISYILNMHEWNCFHSFKSYFS